MIEGFLPILFVASIALASAGTSAFEFDDQQADQASAAAIERAQHAGAQQAAADIATGRFQIIQYGEPVPKPVPPVVPRDVTTGYPILPVHDCTPTPAFEAQVRGYNNTMRGWHAKHTTGSDN